MEGMGCRKLELGCLGVLVGWAGWVVWVGSLVRWCIVVVIVVVVVVVVEYLGALALGELAVPGHQDASGTDSGAVQMVVPASGCYMGQPDSGNGHGTLSVAGRHRGRR